MRFYCANIEYRVRKEGSLLIFRSIFSCTANHRLLLCLITFSRLSLFRCFKCSLLSLWWLWSQGDREKEWKECMTLLLFYRFSLFAFYRFHFYDITHRRRRRHRLSMWEWGFVIKTLNHNTRWIHSHQLLLLRPHPHIALVIYFLQWFFYDSLD